MKKTLLLITCLFPITANCEVISELFCFSPTNKNKLNLELRTYYDTTTKWSGAFIKSAGSENKISLVTESIQSDNLNSQTPEQTTKNWLEVAHGEITGEYEMISQGGNIISMSYTKKSNMERYFFYDNPNVDTSLEDGCKW